MEIKKKNKAAIAMNKLRSLKMTKEERVASATHAIKTRWANRDKKLLEEAQRLNSEKN